jgi:hypothetical protein
MITISKDDLNGLLTDIFEKAVAHQKEISADHAEHHEWICERIRSEEARRVFFQTMTVTVMQYSITALMGGVVYWISTHFKA